MPGAAWSGPRPVPRPALSPEWPGDPDGWRDSRDYLFGVDLFNAGFAWEAHEALEIVWKRLRAADQPHAASHAASMVRAIIQVAAARLKREVGNETGVARLRGRASTNIDAALSERRATMGVDARGWWGACGSWFAHGAPRDPPPPIVLSFA